MSRDEFVLTDESMLVHDAADELTTAIFAEIGVHSIDGERSIREAVWEAVHEGLTELVGKLDRKAGSEPVSNREEP